MARPGTFSLSIGRFAEKTNANIDLVLRKVSIEFYRRVVMRSPVGNPDLWKWPAPPGYVGGSFRNAWSISTGGILILRGSIDIGGKSLPIGTVGLERIKAGERVVILNPLPYGPRLENGWSSQAPAGMVGTTIVEFGGLLRSAAAEVRK